MKLSFLQMYNLNTSTAKVDGTYMADGGSQIMAVIHITDIDKLTFAEIRKRLDQKAAELCKDAP